ncbi:hypothetical protein [Waddlia chondrophila]|uniref:Uncharacterized protein n=1 Tax=Waddlia chondrophila (strain ATCC VR-1470 / WSU 86-1044) TaxID=716544 RepID=D6YU00_WADCW|nr:hypothetical protein [Waddlia chondrophila]ADI37611.1 hypothetical protein wcw_0236 [Waddlia chondrophila WSU 86-1044]
MSVDKIILRSTAKFASTPTPLPQICRVTFLAFHKVHRLWRWVRLGNIYSNPNNFAQLAAGHGINYIIGDSTLVRISAISVLISTRILQAVSEYEKLQDAWLKMKDAFQHHYPEPVRCSWDQTHNFLSLSSIIWIKTTTKTTWCRVRLIAIAIFRVGKHFILLSLRMSDAVEAFTLKPEIREESINLMFVNTATCLSKLVDNKDFLLERLESNQKIIEKVLKGLGSQLTSDALIDTVEEALEKTSSIRRTTSSINDHIGEFISACGKKWTYEFLREVGLRHLVPSTLLPPSMPPWEEPKRRELKQYPPDSWLKRPNIKIQEKKKSFSSQNPLTGFVKKRENRTWV